MGRRRKYGYICGFISSQIKQVEDEGRVNLYVSVWFVRRWHRRQGDETKKLCTNLMHTCNWEDMLIPSREEYNEYVCNQT